MNNQQLQNLGEVTLPRLDLLTEIRRLISLPALEDAFTLCARGFSENPQSALLASLLGELAEATGRLSLAEKGHCRACELEPNTSEYVILYAVHLLRRAKYTDAIDLLEAGTKSEPASTMFSCLRAMAMKGSGRIEEAERLFVDVSQSPHILSPKFDPNLFITAGKSLMECERFAEAHRLFAIASQRFPDQFFFKNMVALAQSALILEDKVFARNFDQRPFPKEPGAGRWPVLIASVPKSGTHMLVQVLRYLRIADLETHVSFPGYVPTDNEDGLDDRKVDMPFGTTLSKVQPGQFLYSHFMHTKVLEKVLRAIQMKSIFIYRDPRDNVVSYLRFVLSESYGKSGESALEFKNKLLRDYPDDAARLHHVLQQVFSAQDMTSYADWLKCDVTLSIKFEDLLEDIYLSREEGIWGATMLKIFEYLELDSSEYDPNKFFGSVYGKGRTYTPLVKKVNQHSKYFNESHHAVFSHPEYQKVFEVMGYSQVSCT